MSKKDVVRFLISVHSSMYVEAINKLNTVFDTKVCKGPNPLYEDGNGYIYMWVKESDIECSFGTSMYDWFEYDALISGIEDIESLPLLYKILR